MLAGQEEWFHPLLNDGRKEGIKHRFVAALTRQATSMTLNAEGEISMAESWARWYRWTHFSPAITGCTVRKLVSPGLEYEAS